MSVHSCHTTHNETRKQILGIVYLPLCFEGRSPSSVTPGGKAHECKNQFSRLSSLSCCVGAEITDACHHFWPFMCDLGSNSGFQAHVASAFDT